MQATNLRTHEQAEQHDTTAFYDAIAEYYPYFYKDWETKLEREGLSLRSIFRKKGVVRVLVTACGVGTQAIPLAKLGFEVVATDPSKGMLDKAQEIAQERGVDENIEFAQASFEELLDVVEGPFDAIVCKGNALPHLVTDEAIETALLIFHELLRPGGTLVLGMRDFDPFMEHRPRFLPGFDHVDDDGNEFISFEIWEYEEGPPMVATQNLYLVKGKAPNLETVKHTAKFRPLSVDEAKVVLMELGFEDFGEYPDRWEQVVHVRKPLGSL
ncbi:MAG: class I SAM-dependent methyltransferase [Chloroflexota bacterium]